MCRRVWETTRKDKKTFLVGIEPMTRWWAPVVLTTAPHLHIHSPLLCFHDTHTHTHTHIRAHILLFTGTHAGDSLHTLSHARKALLGATHTKNLIVCGVGGNVCPNPLRMCVCEACAGQLPLHTLAIFMFGPEFGVQGGKTGGRRPHHRLPRQKLCLMVSSDPNLVSGTQRAVFDRAGFQTQDALILSPAILTPSPARRRLIRRGD